MNPARSLTGFRMSIIVMMLWAIAFSLVCNVTIRPAGGREGSVLANIFGNSRTLFSEHFYEEADRCFHKGVGHFRKKAFQDWFVKLARDITPSKHEHLTGGNVKEIMSWLFFATKMDPHNVVAYTVTAFWLSSGVGRLDLADQVLAEAQRHNPLDYRIYLAKGLLALKQGNLKNATNAFDTGIRLWPSGQDPDDLDTKMEESEMLDYRGLLYESEGNIKQAITLYRKVLDMFPSRVGLKNRVMELETHGQAKSRPFDIWNRMVLHNRHVCEKHLE